MSSPIARIDPAAWTVTGLGLATALTLLIGARDIAPPLFDPVGSAAVPRACAWALIGASAGTLIQAISAAKRRERVTKQDPIRPATFAILFLMIACLGAMTLGLGFTYSVVFFTALAVPTVSGTWRSAPLAIILALLLGFGAEWLFTSVFFIDLPSF